MQASSAVHICSWLVHSSCATNLHTDDLYSQHTVTCPVVLVMVNAPALARMLSSTFSFIEAVTTTLRTAGHEQRGAALPSLDPCVTGTSCVGQYCSAAFPMSGSYAVPPMA